MPVDPLEWPLGWARCRCCSCPSSPEVHLSLQCPKTDTKRHAISCLAVPIISLLQLFISRGSEWCAESGLRFLALASGSRSPDPADRVPSRPRCPLGTRWPQQKFSTSAFSPALPAFSTSPHPHQLHPLLWSFPSFDRTLT